jgi:hypothetical protein
MNRYIKFVVIQILLIAATGYELNAQEIQKWNPQKTISLFESLSTSESKFGLDFIEEKNTLYFTYKILEGNRIGYKVILEDIHPEGIFITETEGKTFLRILSVNNGKIFVKEQFRGEFRLSNNTNLIDIELPEDFNEIQLKKFIENLKSIFVEEKVQSIDNIDLPKTKND